MREAVSTVSRGYEYIFPESAVAANVRHVIVRFDDLAGPRIVRGRRSSGEMLFGPFGEFLKVGRVVFAGFDADFMVFAADDEVLFGRVRV